MSSALERRAAGGVDAAVLDLQVVARRSAARATSSCELGRVGGDGQQRAGRDVAGELEGDHRAAAVPAEHQRPLGRAFAAGGAARWRPWSMASAGTAAILMAASSSAMMIACMPGRDHGVHRRIELDPAVGIAEADQRAGLIGHQRVAEGLAGERRLLGGVDLAAVEIEQLGIDRAQARTGGSSGRRCARSGRRRAPAAPRRRRRSRATLGILRRRGFRRRSGSGSAPAVGIVDQRQHRLDDLAVGIVAPRATAR